jgi:hypothetical protein
MLTLCLTTPVGGPTLARPPRSWWDIRNSPVHEDKQIGSGPVAPTLTYWQTSTAAEPPALTREAIRPSSGAVDHRRTSPANVGGRPPTTARGTIDSCRDQVTLSETEQMLVNQSQPPGVERDQSDGADGNRADHEPRARRPGRLVTRRAGNPEVDLLGDLDDEQHAGAEQLVNCDLVAAALDGLTQEHRDVLRECYFRSSSVAQAADALEIAPDLVKSRAYYALHALRLAIEELGGVQ